MLFTLCMHTFDLELFYLLLAYYNLCKKKYFKKVFRVYRIWGNFTRSRAPTASAGDEGLHAWSLLKSCFR